MLRRCATRASSLHLYRIGQLTPTSGPAASKYSQTRRSIRGGRKCVWMSASPGSPSPCQKAVTSASSAGTSTSSIPRFNRNFLPIREPSAFKGLHPDLVLLNSTDGASVELRISGYQFPEYKVTIQQDWDANWLNVRGNMTQADGKTWSFDDPSLTSWEARTLGTWLHGAAAGTVAAASPSGIGEPQQLLTFTEPNLAFSLESRTGDQVRIRAYFSLESMPPWLRGQNQPDIFDYFLCLDLSAAELADAARTWTRALAEYPEL